MAHPYSAIPIVEFPERMGPGRPEFLAQAAQEYGPLFRRVFQEREFGVPEWLYMVGPESNRFVFQSHRSHFSHDLGWSPLIGEELGHGLLNMDPPEHTRHRGMMNPAFTSAYMATYLPIMHRVIAERTQDWPERDDIDLFSEAREITFDVAASALVGARTGPQVDRLRELFYQIIHGFDGEKETWEEFAARQLKIRDELIMRVLPMIHERRKATSESQSADVLGMIVRAHDEAGRALSDEQIMAHVNILLVAGHETTTTLGAWLLYLLATHPDYLARVRAELAESLPSADAPITFDAIKSTPVLGNAIKEAGRLYAPVNLLPRGILRPVEFAGYEIPEGTTVRVAIAATHRLPSVFPEPERFDPDRFAPPRDEERRTPYALAIFGGGPRICIGINFAQIEVKALVAHVVRRYDLTPLSDETPRTWPGITLFLPDGIHVRARRQVAER